MSGRVEIRDARPEEREAVRRLTEEAYDELRRVMEPRAWEGLAGAMRSGLASDLPERIVAVDRENGEILGSVLLFPPAVDAYGEHVVPRGEGPELRLLAVSPGARGRGVGRMLVEECVRRAREAGAPELGLHTSRSMGAAIRLYEGMGFERVPERDFQPEGAERVTGYRLAL
jgi:ribosomal protein S18 acetylase RimI-like enzyme